MQLPAAAAATVEQGWHSKALVTCVVTGAM